MGRPALILLPIGFDAAVGYDGLRRYLGLAALAVGGMRAVELLLVPFVRGSGDRTLGRGPPAT